MKGETTTPPPGRADARLSPLAALVRQHDHDRFLAALFVPEPAREALFALYAFNFEIARVCEIVSEPMLGQIRLQWWREVVGAAYAGVPPRAHPVAEALTAAIRKHGLTRNHFDRMIDAHERDLDDAAPATLAVLEDYAEATAGGLVHLALEILDVREGAATEAACEAGIAYGLAGLLRAMPFHARIGRRTLPAETAQAAGLDLCDIASPRSRPALQRAVAVIGEAATAHLHAARRQRLQLPRAALPALLPAVAAAGALRRLRRAGWDPFAPRVAAPDPLLSWRFAAAMLLRRY